MDDGSPGVEELKKLIIAGGGEFFPAKEGAATGAHVVVVNPSKTGKEPGLRKLMNAGVVPVSPQYLAEWISNPWSSLSESRLFECEASDELTELEAGRASGTGSGGSPGEQPGSVSQCW